MKNMLGEIMDKKLIESSTLSPIRTTTLDELDLAIKNFQLEYQKYQNKNNPVQSSTSQTHNTTIKNIILSEDDEKQWLKAYESAKISIDYEVNNFKNENKSSGL